jgi:hypothetical protein
MPLLSVAQAARLAQVDRATIRRKIKAGILSASTRPEGGKGIELAELLRAYPGAAAQVAPMSAQGESLMSAQGQDNAGAQGSHIAALERENELLRQELAAAKEREKWLQNQIEQFQQRLLPPPRQPGLDRADCRGGCSAEATEGKYLAVMLLLACIQVLASSPVASGQRLFDNHRGFSSWRNQE